MYQTEEEPLQAETPLQKISSEGDTPLQEETQLQKISSEEDTSSQGEKKEEQMRKYLTEFTRKNKQILNENDDVYYRMLFIYFIYTNNYCIQNMCQYLFYTYYKPNETMNGTKIIERNINIKVQQLNDMLEVFCKDRPDFINYITEQNYSINDIARRNYFIHYIAEQTGTDYIRTRTYIKIDYYGDETEFDTFNPSDTNSIINKILQNDENESKNIRIPIQELYFILNFALNQSLSQSVPAFIIKTFDIYYNNAGLTEDINYKLRIHIYEFKYFQDEKDENKNKLRFSYTSIYEFGDYNELNPPSQNEEKKADANADADADANADADADANPKADVKLENYLKEEYLDEKKIFKFVLIQDIHYDLSNYSFASVNKVSFNFNKKLNEYIEYLKKKVLQDPNTYISQVVQDEDIIDQNIILVSHQERIKCFLQSKLYAKSNNSLNERYKFKNCCVLKLSLIFWDFVIFKIQLINEGFVKESSSLRKRYWTTPKGQQLLDEKINTESDENKKKKLQSIKNNQEIFQTLEGRINDLNDFTDEFYESYNKLTNKSTIPTPLSHLSINKYKHALTQGGKIISIPNINDKEDFKSSILTELYDKKYRYNFYICRHGLAQHNVLKTLSVARLRVFDSDLVEDELIHLQNSSNTIYEDIKSQEPSSQQDLSPVSSLGRSEQQLNGSRQSLESISTSQFFPAPSSERNPAPSSDAQSPQTQTNPEQPSDIIPAQSPERNSAQSSRRWFCRYLPFFCGGKRNPKTITPINNKIVLLGVSDLKRTHQTMYYLLYM